MKYLQQGHFQLGSEAADPPRGPHTSNHHFPIFGHLYMVMHMEVMMQQHNIYLETQKQPPAMPH